MIPGQGYFSKVRQTIGAFFRPGLQGSSGFTFRTEADRTAVGAAVKARLIHAYILPQGWEKIPVQDSRAVSQGGEDDTSITDETRQGLKAELSLGKREGP